MKKTEYTCNVCYKLLKKNNEKAVESFIGVEFGRVDSREGLIVKNFNDVHRHFCFDCMTDLSSIFIAHRDNPNSWNLT